MKSSLLLDELHKKAARYCAYQERCHQEVVQKLKQLGATSLMIDIILTSLIQDKFLNETRFAIAYASGKFSIKKWGKLKIVGELKKRNISEKNIEIALNQIDGESYLNTFNEIANKKIAALKDKYSIQEQKSKLKSFLVYKGWEFEKIHEKITEVYY